jgi:hypothetical protein
MWYLAGLVGTVLLFFAFCLFEDESPRKIWGEILDYKNWTIESILASIVMPTVGILLGNITMFLGILALLASLLKSGGGKVKHYKPFGDN